MSIASRFWKNFLLAKLDPKKADGLVGEVVEAIQDSGGTDSLSLIAQDQGISLRQLERRFVTSVGLTAKKFVRIVRFQKVFRALREV
jgi:methylphosphotriester-DNA--protein-cysteine methyltransferase